MKGNSLIIGAVLLLAVFFVLGQSNTDLNPTGAAPAKIKTHNPSKDFNSNGVSAHTSQAVKADLGGNKDAILFVTDQETEITLTGLEPNTNYISTRGMHFEVLKTDSNGNLKTTSHYLQLTKAE